MLHTPPFTFFKGEDTERQAEKLLPSPLAVLNLEYLAQKASDNYLTHTSDRKICNILANQSKNLENAAVLA